MTDNKATQQTHRNILPFSKEFVTLSDEERERVRKDIKE
jgi:hypothetical protein